MAKKEEKANKENEKNKKSFFKGFKAELKKVSWSTPKQLINSTIAVITIVLITAAIVFVLDFAFESINKYGINRIKTSIGTLSEEEDATENNETEDNVTEENSDNSTENVESVTENIQSVE